MSNAGISPTCSGSTSTRMLGRILVSSSMPHPLLPPYWPATDTWPIVFLYVTCMSKFDLETLDISPAARRLDRSACGRGARPDSLVRQSTQPMRTMASHSLHHTIPHRAPQLFCYGHEAKITGFGIYISVPRHEPAYPLVCTSLVLPSPRRPRSAKCNCCAGCCGSPACASLSKV